MTLILNSSMIFVLYLTALLSTTDETHPASGFALETQTVEFDMETRIYVAIIPFPNDIAQTCLFK